MVIVLSMAALISLAAAQRSAEARAAELYSRAIALTQENEGLRYDIANVLSPEGVEKIAREELDLVKPGTVFFHMGE